MPNISAPFVLSVEILPASTFGASSTYMGELYCVGMSLVRITSFTPMATPWSGPRFSRGSWSSSRARSRTWAGFKYAHALTVESRAEIRERSDLAYSSMVKEPLLNLTCASEAVRRKGSEEAIAEYTQGKTFN